IALHPKGLAPRIANFAEWRSDLLARLRRQVDVSADPVLAALYDELASYPAPRQLRPAPANPAAVAVPLRLMTDHGLLSFLSTITVFGTPIDITLSELAIETFLPADRETAKTLGKMAAAGLSRS
ncbi:MAG TPA: transcriptional regulator, partial [Stellaceae bacterium]|nr:transcriptional regulator [Stellaceae bacterium]